MTEEQIRRRMRSAKIFAFIGMGGAFLILYALASYGWRVMIPCFFLMVFTVFWSSGLNAVGVMDDRLKKMPKDPTQFTEGELLAYSQGWGAGWIDGTMKKHRERR